MSDVVEDRINRVNTLLDRLDKIPAELDEVETRLFEGGLTRQEFTELAARRCNLIIEQQKTEKELKTVYRLIL